MVNVHVQQFAPGGAVVDADAMEQFNKQWGAYQKLVDSDVLSHKAAGRLFVNPTDSLRIFRYDSCA